MGEVYRAKDTKLGRDVALKILPAAFTTDAERLARFRREAQVLASLNHPHIGAIYGVDEANGQQFLVLELADGESLDRRIARGALPVDESLAIAKQVAEALEAAHERGIIHRDLKPANIAVTKDGRVKVLDFGLAKPTEASGLSIDLANSPTITSPAMMTGVGVIVGTAAYMSPEQAKGRPADTRSDVWAFGCVLFEMLTGTRAFSGDSVTEILAAVLRSEPEWAALPAATPPAVRRLLRRCVQKDRTRRLQNAGDVRLEIEEAPGEPVLAPRESRLAWIVAAVLALALGSALAAPYLRKPVDAPEMRVEIVTPPTPDPISFAISPDGRRLAFVASGGGAPRLWVRSLDASTAQVLAGTENASYPFWSPDSRSVGFFAANKLMRFDIGGGLPRTLATVAGGRGATWSSGNVIVFAPATNGVGLFRVSASGGQVTEATTLQLPRQVGHRFPQFLPDGRRFLFWVNGALDARGIYLGSLDSSEIKRVTEADSAGLYMPGWLLFVRQTSLVARRFDLSRGQVTSDAVSVADPVGIDSNGVGAFSVSSTGVVAYRAGVASQRQLVWFDRSGKVLGPLSAPDENSPLAPTLSPDGRRVALTRVVQGNQDVWLLDGTRTTRFTFDPATESFPIWSPDGSRIVFDSARKTGVRDLYQKLSSGSGDEQLLFESDQSKAVNSYSSDGRFLLFSSTDPKNLTDLWVLPMDGSRKPFPFVKTPFDERSGMISADGRWVSYLSNESGRYEIYVRPFPPTSGGQWQVSTAGGVQPRWRRDGKELYYIAPDGKLMAVAIAVNGSTLEPGTPVALFQTRIFGGGASVNSRQQYDVAPDGRFLINVTIDDTNASPITLLLNWKPPSK
jgi:serine/threonine protein kinase